MEGTNEHNEPYYHSGIGLMTIHNEGYISYRPHKKHNNSRHQVDVMQQELDFLLKNLNGKKLPFLTDNRELKKMDGKEFQFMRTKMHLFTNKAAAIVKDGLSKYVMHMVLHFFRPPFPFKFFTNETQALEWLLSPDN